MQKSLAETYVIQNYISVKIKLYYSFYYIKTLSNSGPIVNTTIEFSK